MKNRLIECVPNFSEGRRPEAVESIVNAISGTPCGPGELLKVLHVDSGAAANRTVVTFAGTPEAVVEAAFRAVRKASEVIDMRKHHGEHPRIGATDVLPLVPVSGISIEECAELARVLAARIYEELGIPCFCYEAAALIPERRRLEVCRAGEYESLPASIADPLRRPDFSPESYNETVARAGASVVGARNFLIAVNFNLDSADVAAARRIAARVRESGQVMHDASGAVVKDSSGKPVRIPGTLKGCKAIGWYIEEYGIAQVSMNITDIHLTSLHEAYLEVCRVAQEEGVRITGTEIIGLVPEQCLLDAGEYFHGLLSGSGDRTSSSTPELSRDELILTAISALHLDDLRPFDPAQKIIERLLFTGRCTD